jgi:hypothetical protein
MLLLLSDALEREIPESGDLTMRVREMKCPFNIK